MGYHGGGGVDLGPNPKQRVLPQKNVPFSRIGLFFSLITFKQNVDTQIDQLLIPIDRGQLDSYNISGQVII